MKLRWFLVALIPFPLIQAQITPNQGLANRANAGIPGVTVTNLTQTPMEQARNFFIVGGVDLRPNPQNQTAGRNSSLAGTSKTPSTGPTDQQLQYLTRTRDQLAKQHVALAGAIAEKQRTRKPWAEEAGQHVAIQRAIQQLDVQIAQRSAALKRGPNR